MCRTTSTFLMGMLCTLANSTHEPVLLLLEQELRDIESLLLKKTHEYLTCAQQLGESRKQRYHELCKEMVAGLIYELQQQGISPAACPTSYTLSTPLTTPDGYLINIVDPREALENHIGEAASSWKYNQFFGTILPCIFVMLPQPGCGGTLATRYLSPTKELGPLLAHEIGHLWNFHDHEMNRCIDRYNTYLYVTAGTIAGASIAGMTLYGKKLSTEAYDRHPRLTFVTAVTGCIALFTGLAVLHAKIKQFSRRQELEADQFIAALGDKSLQQFITTLMRWYLNDQLAHALRPKTWLTATLDYATKMLDYCKKRAFGTHPSHLQRLFHAILTWRTLKMKKLYTTITSESVIQGTQQEIAQLCHEALLSMPELCSENLSTTLRVNFPQRVFTQGEERLIDHVLQKARQEFSIVIEKALHSKL